MDILVRYWSSTNRITSGYVTSVFVGHGRLDDMMEHFMSATNEHGRPQKKMQAMLSGIRGLASEPCSRVLHGQFSKNTASLTMHGLDLTMPRRCARQVHRPNVGGSIEEYYRRTIYVPYRDSMMQSLESRFGESNTPYFHIFALHPREMQQTERDEFKHIVSSVKEMYGIDNLVEEALAWYDVQKHKPLDDNSLGMIELVKQTTICSLLCAKQSSSH